MPQSRSQTSNVTCQWSDGALATAVIARREDAYAELYRRHSPSVGAAVRMLLGDSPVCDEIVADVFVEFWFSPDSFNPARGSVLSYLRLRARSHSMDVLRSEKSRRRREAGGGYPDHDPSASLDSAVLVAEVAATLRRAVASLPTGEQEAISLAFFGGMTYRAVALHLDVAEGTVKTRIRHGLRRLRVAPELCSSWDIDPITPLTTDRRPLIPDNAGGLRRT